MFTLKVFSKKVKKNEEGEKMRSKCGKAFQNVLTREIECFSYNPQQNYYDVVRDASKKGYQQSIFTSSVMISLIEDFLLQFAGFVTEIEFLVEDEDLDREIKVLIDKMKVNGAYWEILKEKLSFLSRYDSIDIKKVSITSKSGAGFLLSLQVNGIFIVSENAYDFVSTEISRVVRRVIA